MGCIINTLGVRLRLETAITLAFDEARLDSDYLPSILESAEACIQRLHSADENGSALAELVDRVELSRDGIRLSLAVPTTSPEAGENRNTGSLSLVRIFPMQMRRRGIEMRMVLQGDNSAPRFDRPLVKAISRARKWSQLLLSGEAPSIGAICRREHIAPRYVRDLLPLAFLSPRIVEAIVEGRQPAELTVIGLTRRTQLPLLWHAQEQTLGLRA